AHLRGGSHGQNAAPGAEGEGHMRRFASEDLSTLNAWRAGHRLRPLRRKELPEFGLIVDGAAIGFLLRTEWPELAMLDAFITCPEARRRRRHAAIKQITRALCEEAQRRGVARLVSFTESRGIATVAQGLGFQVGGNFQAVQKEL